MNTGHYLLAALLGFLSGSMLFSLWLPKWLMGIDVREGTDDENPGTYNVFSKCGKLMGIACLLCDLAKGFVPVYLAARCLNILDLRFALVLATPVLGHCYSPFLHFRGGKGICTSFGVLLGLLPVLCTVLILAFFYLFFSLVVVLNPNTLRTVATFVLFPATTFLLAPSSIALGCVLFSAAVIHKNTRLPMAEEDKEVFILRRRVK